MEKISCDKENAVKIAKIIAEGGTIVFPTDTVYGIGCNPFDKAAVEKIYKIKQREKIKKLPILGFSKRDIESIVEFTPNAEKIAAKYWPGKVTLVLKLKEEKLQESLGITEKIAVRVPNSKCALSILEKCRLLVGTSANKAGVKSFVNPKDCLENIKDYDVFVDGGVIKSTGESTIIDCTLKELAILREGAIKSQELKELI